jgi:hypothetical protein
MSRFLILVVKYVGGSLDLLLAPLLILLLNKEVRIGVTVIYRSAPSLHHAYYPGRGDILIF